MEESPSTESLQRALRKISAALQGVHRRPVAVGPIALRAWGVACEPRSIDLLIPPGEEHRPTICSAARGEGFQEIPADGGTLRFRMADAKAGSTVEVTLVEAATPLLRQAHGRAQEGVVLQMNLPLAPCEDLILLLAAAGDPAVVELLRRTAARMDAAYLKAEAEKAGLLEKVKAAWQKARQD